MDKYKEAYIDSLKSKKFEGWTFLIVCVLTNIALWIFGKPELWSLKSKIIATFVMMALAYAMGISQIHSVKKELNEIEEEGLR